MRRFVAAARLSPFSVAPQPVALLAQLARVLVGVALLTAASRAYVPFVGTHVPFTLQGQAVIAVAAWLGGRAGLAAVLGWLGCAAAGLPVLSGPSGSGAALLGPTAGYLWSYPLVALWIGHFGRATDARAFAAWLGANAFTLAMGVCVLAAFVGPRAAIAMGLAPFVVGDVAKLAALFVGRRLWRR